MNMCVNDVRLDEHPNLLHPKSKYQASVVISQYHLEYNLLTTLKFNNSHEITNA